MKIDFNDCENAFRAALEKLREYHATCVYEDGSTQDIIVEEVRDDVIVGRDPDTDAEDRKRVPIEGIVEVQL